jgi:lysozyme
MIPIKGLAEDFRQLVGADLIRDEGERLKVYKCSEGYITIGIGRNIQTKGISQAESRFLFKNDLDETAADLDRACPWWRDMPAPHQRALFNMCFNLGMTRLSGFKGMLGALQNGAGDDAARHALNSKWASQVGARANRIALLFKAGGNG